MPTKIRLQRRGKKGQPYYHIVIADGRAPRDGRFIEKIGTYNPLTKPASIDINFERALQWLQNGAQPTDTAKAILSYKGVLYKNHLLKGVQKGALTLEQAEEKFQVWSNTKEESILQKVKQEELTKKERKKKLHELEMKTNEVIATRVAAKRAAKIAAEKAETEEEPAVAEEETAVAEEEVMVAEEQETVAEVTSEPETVAEESPAEGTETVAEETEAPAADRIVEETVDQAPVEEILQEVTDETVAGKEAEAEDVPEASEEEEKPE